MVKGNPIVIEEIRDSSSAGWGESSFYDYRISLAIGKLWIEKEGQYIPTLSDNPFAWLMPFCESELHLAYMP